MKFNVRSGALLLRQGLCFHASKTPYKPLHACVRYKSSTQLTTSYLHSVGSWSLHEKTVGQLLDAADRNYGKREAVVSVHQGIRKTFSEARLDADQLAAGFLAHGLQRGDRIGIWGSNTYEWYLTQYAAAKAGLILVNINPGYRLEELKFCLNKVRVKAMVCDEKFKTSNYYEMLCQLAPELLDGQEELVSNQLPYLKRVIIIADKQLRGAHKFQDVCNAGDSNHMREIEELSHKIQFDEPCNIQFTSGTTGQPKAATLSHHMIVNNAFNVGNRCSYGLKEHRICMTVPLYHCFGCVLGSLNGAHFGATCVFPSPGFDPQAAVQAMQDERVTSCYGTPTMFVDILNAQRSNQRDVSSLSTGIMSGAPCPQELVLALINEMNMKDILVMYGMTETSPVTFQCYPTDPVSVRSSTIGYPSDHTEVKIIDEEGKVTPIGVGGELCIRGYCTFLGYWDDVEKTKEVLQEDRWLKTGDLAILQPDGYGKIIGRIKDMIIRGGENLFPAEIENFLMGHPEVLEAQVFGIPDSRMGEEAVAWIRSAQNSTLTEESLKLWCKGKIAHFKIPKHIIFKEEFPRTVTGKIQKFVMRNITTKELQLKE
ncbi:medium-chain acyl-CoA ligase ACSF2, mitochondrial-like [Macrobrachium rosenbergii]|uniref:medium-chain acyl-CoA ligase ACSF2, mitochondrial-like n=1 Tax=Macrobrachium rosenbergii TaxID=79674 RepID=UPI0034D726C6